MGLQGYIPGVTCLSQVTCCSEVRELQWYLILPHMTQAWCDAGESWLEVNSRIVSVRLQFSGSGSQQFMTIVSVYAPTHRAPAEVKQ